MQPDNRTISEIVENPELPQEEEGEEPEEDRAIPTAELKPGTFITSADSMKAALEYAPGINERREQAQIPPQLQVKELVGKTFIVLDKVRQKAALPDTGEMRNGWQCLCVEVETEKPFTVWIGQVALMSDLDAVVLPFRATISRRGRTYQFS